MKKAGDKRQDVINFSGLEYYITHIETFLKGAGRNNLEQDLILSQALNRVRKRAQHASAQDLMQNVSIGGLMKRVWRSADKERRDEEDG